MEEDKRKNKIKKYVDQLEKKKDRTAVAVRYQPGKDGAPMIIATGKGSIAEEILKVAEDNSIPLFEDQAMSDLLSKLELDTEVPPELYVLVAEVLAFVYALDTMAAKRESVRKAVKESKES